MKDEFLKHPILYSFPDPSFTLYSSFILHPSSLIPHPFACAADLLTISRNMGEMSKADCGQFFGRLQTTLLRNFLFINLLDLDFVDHFFKILMMSVHIRVRKERADLEN